MFLYEPGTTDLSSYFGLAKCTVLPPDDLYHPVLPYHHQAKLTFLLCRTCVEENLDQSLLDKTTTCPHTYHQRTLTGTRCTPQIKDAMRRVYQILHMHEIWHFPLWCTGLFTPYIGT